MVCQETFLPPSPLLANNFGPGIWMFSCNCVERVEVKEAVGRSNYILKMFCYWYILEKLSKCLLYTRSYYRKQNAADMYMQDVLQPKSVFFTVCMI